MYESKTKTVAAYNVFVPCSVIASNTHGSYVCVLCCRRFCVYAYAQRLKKRTAEKKNETKRKLKREERSKTQSNNFSNFGPRNDNCFITRVSSRKL